MSDRSSDSMSDPKAETPESFEARADVRRFLDGASPEGPAQARTKLREHPEFSTEFALGAAIIDDILAGNPDLVPDARGWFFVASVNLDAGRVDRARDFLLRGFDRIDGDVETTEISDAYLTLGLLEAKIQAWDRAIEAWRQALKLLPPCAAREMRLRQLLAEGWETLGDAENTEHHLQEGLKVAAQQQSIHDECEFLCHLGRHRHVCDDLRNAAAFYLHAITRGAEEGFERGEAAARIGYGAVCLDLDEIEEAERALHDGLASARQVEDRLLQLAALERLAELQEVIGDYDRARRAIEEAVFVSQGLGSDVALGCLHHRLGLLHETAGKDSLAFTAYGRAVEERRSSEDYAGLGATLNNLGALHHRRGELDDARQSYREALLALNECGHDRGELEVVLENLSRLESGPDAIDGDEGDRSTSER